jgi:hypothetical protein
MSMAKVTTVRRDLELPYQRLEEETIVVDPRTRQVHLLNDTAARVWELLATPQSIEALVAVLGDEYDAPAGELNAAVAELLADFGQKGLLAA